jgi:hypothetical protein
MFYAFLIRGDPGTVVDWKIMKNIKIPGSHPSPAILKKTFFLLSDLRMG